MRRFLCSLGLHKKQEFREVLFKSKFFEDVGITVKCKRCGVVLKKYGVGHFGPVTICLGEKK